MHRKFIYFILCNVFSCVTVLEAASIASSGHAIGGAAGDSHVITKALILSQGNDLSVEKDGIKIRHLDLGEPDKEPTEDGLKTMAFLAGYIEPATVDATGFASLQKRTWDRRLTTNWRAMGAFEGDTLIGVLSVGMMSSRIAAVPGLRDSMAHLGLWHVEETIAASGEITKTPRYKEGAAFGAVHLMIHRDSSAQYNSILRLTTELLVNMIDLASLSPFNKLPDSSFPHHITVNIHPSSPLVPLLRGIGYKVAGEDQADHMSWLFNADKPRLAMYFEHFATA